MGSALSAVQGATTTCDTSDTQIHRSSRGEDVATTRSDYWTVGSVASRSVTFTRGDPVGLELVQSRSSSGVTPAKWDKTEAQTSAYATVNACRSSGPCDEEYALYVQLTAWAVFSTGCVGVVVFFYFLCLF